MRWSSKKDKVKYDKIKKQETRNKKHDNETRMKDDNEIGNKINMNNQGWIICKWGKEYNGI